MALSITNQTLTISLIEGAVTTVIRKDNLKVQAFGDVVRLTDYSGVIYEFLYTDCTSPSEASANALRDAINVFLITATGGGGGGSVNSVNAGINISVTGTATDPIINSLSDRYKTTSTTSNSVSNGSKSFTIGTNLSYIPLQEILVVYDASNHMQGEVTSYNSSTGALVVEIKNHTGSGTYTAWVLNLDGTPVDALTGTGTANEIAYFTATRVLSSLAVATYPSLTELSYVKGVTSAIQTQMNGKQDTLVSGTNIKTINGASVLGSGNLALNFELVVAASDEVTALTTGLAKVTFRMPRAVTLTSVRASLTTAQASGSIFTVDINEGGTSILSTKLTIDNTEKTSTTAATPPVISDTALADDAEMTVDIDQIGSGTAAGLKVYLIGTYA
jgi:hypothetical protein